MAPKLPKNATVYIVAPHELFVTNLIPMTFFLLLLAFTDGTATSAEVLPRRALAQLAEYGDVLALDNDGVESYVYDSSLPAFHRCGGCGRVAGCLVPIVRRVFVPYFRSLRTWDHKQQQQQRRRRRRHTGMATYSYAWRCFIFSRNRGEHQSLPHGFSLEGTMS